MTDGLSAPAGAAQLLNGQDVSNWTKRDGSPAEWLVEDGILKVVPKKGDIMSVETFGDHYLHLEFRCPDMPEATGQAKGNSGVFLLGRYEIQVLDSFGWAKPGKGDCGAIYNQFAPLSNGCRKPTEWQTYDVAFRIARLDESGNVRERVRLTVFHNGICIHNNIELPGVTGAPLDTKEGVPGPLLLQDHGDLVQYRNVWVVPLPAHGSTIYGPE